MNMGRTEMRTKARLEHLKWGKLSQNVVIHGRILFNWSSQKKNGMVWTHLRDDRTQSAFNASKQHKVKVSHYRPGQAFRAPGWGTHHFYTIETWRYQGCQSHAPAALPPGDIPGTRSFQRLSAARIGIRTLHIPPCSAVPQPTEPPLVQVVEGLDRKLELHEIFLTAHKISEL